MVTSFLSTISNGHTVGLGRKRKIIQAAIWLRAAGGGGGSGGWERLMYCRAGGNDRILDYRAASGKG